MDLANKYRPKCLDDLVGQEPVVKTLRNAIENNSLHHAYLLVGNFGSGKTTCARILSAMINCENTPGINPCNKCDTCLAIFSGKHTDIEEIDAASGAGNVEQIRKIKQDAQYNPVSGAKKKIYIIDEVHACSPASCDALLKVLEEPPPRVMFILATTDPQKLKATIESRCQRHDFRKIPWTIISERLNVICKQEKINCDAGAINLCARLSKGSMRSALQNLDKLIAFVGSSDISLQHAQSLFGQASETMYYDLIDQIIGMEDGKPDASEGFRIINDILGAGVSFQSIYESISEHFRNLMVGLTSAKASKFLNFSEEGGRRLTAQLKKCIETGRLNAVLDSIKLLHEAKRSVDYNISPDIALQQWMVESIFVFRRGSGPTQEKGQTKS